MKIKKRDMYLLLVGLIIILGWTVYFFSLSTSFQKLVTDRLNVSDITSIHVEKLNTLDQGEKEITDKSAIESIVKELSYMKLKKSDSFTFTNDAYFINVKVDGQLRFSIKLDVHGFLSVTESGENFKNNGSTYKITNKYDKELIEKLLN